MACEFICSDCKGDGTRCRCHEKRVRHYVPITPGEIEEEIERSIITSSKSLGEALYLLTKRNP